MKTRFLSLVLIAGLLTLPLVPVSAQEEAPAAPVEMNLQQLNDRLNALMDAAVSCMQQIQDVSSAASAPQAMTEIIMKIDALEDQSRAAGLEPSEEMMKKMEEQSHLIETEVRRIAAADFYGDTQLNRFCRYMFGDALEGDYTEDIPAATPEVIRKLIESRRENIDRTLADFSSMLKGGPGFTQETAWQILTKDDYAVRFEYFLMYRMQLTDNKTQSLVEKEGRYFDCHEIIVEVDGTEYLVQQWFDITPYYQEFSKHFEEEENEQQ